MFRYIVAIWCSENDEQTCAAEVIASRLEAAHWQEPMRAEGMRVFQTGWRPGGLETRVLPDRAGVVIGRTFVRPSDVLDETPVALWDANAADTQEILES